MEPSGRARDAPDGRLAGGKHGLELGRQASGGHRDRAKFPGSGPSGSPDRCSSPRWPWSRRTRRDGDAQPSAIASRHGAKHLHSVTSTCAVFDPLTTTSPVGICNSSILEPRGTHTPCAACVFARIRPTEGGGSGKSWPEPGRPGRFARRAHTRSCWAGDYSGTRPVAWGSAARSADNC